MSELDGLWLALVPAADAAPAGDWQVPAARGMVYRGSAVLRRPRRGAPPGVVLRRSAPGRLLLPAPESWGDLARVRLLREALAAALEPGSAVALVEVGRLGFRPVDPLDAALLRLAVACLEPSAQTRTSTGSPTGSPWSAASIASAQPAAPAGGRSRPGHSQHRPHSAGIAAARVVDLELQQQAAGAVGPHPKADPDREDVGVGERDPEKPTRRRRRKTVPRPHPAGELPGDREDQPGNGARGGP